MELQIKMFSEIESWMASGVSKSSFLEGKTTVKPSLIIGCPSGKCENNFIQRADFKN